MHLAHLRRAVSWLAPGALVIAAASTAERVLAPSTLASLTDGYPYAVFAAGILLAWRFHRSRIVAALLALALTTYVLDRAHAAVPSLPLPFAAFLLPVVLAVLSLMRDRGALTPFGLAQIALAPLAAVATLIGLEVWGVELVNLMLAAPLALGPASALELPQLALAAFVIGLAIALGVALIRGKAVEKGIAWSIVAAFLAFETGAGTGASTLHLSAAGFILALSVIETSYRLAYRDELTGLPARRALPDALAGLGRCYAIAMVDVDHFKRFNDRHGHDVGDQVLRMVASKLGRVGGGGRAFRYGGEEFALVFPGKSKRETLEHLEELRAAVADADFTLRGRGRSRRKCANASRGRKVRRNGRRRKLSVTVSIGVAERTERCSSPDDVLRAADKALYRAKRAGRNRVAK